jgi:hypothetical protein
VNALSFAAPAALLAGVMAALGITLLHFLTRQRPPRALLPTARFVPEGRATSTSRARRPNDPLLLALRIATILVAAAAFARPTLAPERRQLTRVFLLDRSRAVADPAQGAREIRALWREGDVVIAFDTSATTLRWPVADSAPRIDARPGSLSVGLAAALRALPDLGRTADSLELIVVSPFAADEVDRASARLRALWPGGVRLARVEARRRRASASTGLDVRSAVDDPLSIAAALAGARGFDVPVRLVRDSSSPADSAWAAADGGVLVRWPSSAGSLPGGVRRAAADSSGAVEASGVVVVSPFLRRWSLAGGIVRARWLDGEPAAVERPAGEGCIRDVGIDVPVTGDLVLTPAFGRLLRALSGPCVNAPPTIVLPDSALTWLTQRNSDAPLVSLPSDAASLIAPWLFAGALALALLELLVRRRKGLPLAGERMNGGAEATPQHGGEPVRVRAAGGSR